MAGLDGVKMGMYDDKFRLYGLSSTFDTQSLVDMELEMLKIKNTTYSSRIEYYQGEKNIWTQLRSLVSEFENTVFNLRTMTSLNKDIVYSNQNIARVTAGVNSVAGTYNLEVQKLATLHKFMSDKIENPLSPLGFEGTVKINEKDLKITSQMTINDIANTINRGNYGAKVININGHIILTSTKEGSEGRINLTDAIVTQVRSSNEAKATVKTTDESLLESKNYSLEIQQIASKQIVSSNVVNGVKIAQAMSGSFSIGGISYNVKETDTVEDIIAQINGNENSKVVASLDSNNKLIFTSKSTGATNGFDLVDVTTNGTTSLFQSLGMIDSEGKFLQQTSEAKDSMFTLDGVSYSHSENIAKVAPGLEITLKEVTTEAINITVDKSSSFFQKLGFVLSDGTIKNNIEEAQDAQFTIDGISFTSSTNKVSNAVTGIDIELIGTTTSPLKITLKENTEAVRTRVSEFATNYNKLIAAVNELTAKEAVLQGESIPKKIKDDMARGLMEKSDSSLMAFQIGLSMDAVAKDGSIKFDETVLAKMVLEKPEEVLKMFTGENGIATKLYRNIRIATSETGTIQTKIKGLESSITELNKTIEKNNIAFERQKESILRKYANFEIMLANLNSQEQYVTASLKSLEPTKE